MELPIREVFMEIYYYGRHEAKIGPVTEEDLIRLAEAGQVTETSQLAVDGKRIRAEEFKSLQPIFAGRHPKTPAEHETENLHPSANGRTPSDGISRRNLLLFRLVTDKDVPNVYRILGITQCVLLYIAIVFFALCVIIGLIRCSFLLFDTRLPIKGRLTVPLWLCTYWAANIIYIFITVFSVKYLYGLALGTGHRRDPQGSGFDAFWSAYDVCRIILQIFLVIQAFSMAVFFFVFQGQHLSLSVGVDQKTMYAWGAFAWLLHDHLRPMFVLSASSITLVVACSVVVLLFCWLPSTVRTAEEMQRIRLRSEESFKNGESPIEEE